MKSLSGLMKTAIFLGGALWMLSDATGRIVDEIRLRGDTRTAQGVVVAKSQSGTARSRRWPGVSNYLRGHSGALVRYTFRLPDGATTLTNERPVSLETWNTLEEDAPIAVRYAVANPGVNRPEGQSVLVMSSVRWFVGLVLAVLGGFGLKAMAATRRASRDTRRGSASARGTRVGP